MLLSSKDPANNTLTPSVACTLNTFHVVFCILLPEVHPYPLYERFIDPCRASALAHTCRHVTYIEQGMHLALLSTIYSTASENRLYSFEQRSKGFLYYTSVNFLTSVVNADGHISDLATASRALQRALSASAPALQRSSALCHKQ